MDPHHRRARLGGPQGGSKRAAKPFGLGRAFVEAVQQLDYTLIMGTTVFYGSFLVAMVILVDLIYGLIDPRVRLS